LGVLVLLIAAACMYHDGYSPAVVKKDKITVMHPVISENSSNLVCEFTVCDVDSLRYLTSPP
jgi:hypothetical protein